MCIREVKMALRKIKNRNKIAGVYKATTQMINSCWTGWCKMVM